MAMKIDDNGVIRDMTSEEEAEWYRSQQGQSPTLEDRVDNLESNVSDIINGVTE